MCECSCLCVYIYVPCISVSGVSQHSWVMLCWGSNPGLPACKAGTVPTEAHPQPIYLWLSVWPYLNVSSTEAGNLLSASSLVPGAVSDVGFFSSLFHSPFLCPSAPCAYIKGISMCQHWIFIPSTPLYWVWASDVVLELCLLLPGIMAHSFLNGCFQLANTVNNTSGNSLSYLIWETLKPAADLKGFYYATDSLLSTEALALTQYCVMLFLSY